MRAVVFLLILANLLFLAWAQGYFGPSSNPDSLRVKQQLLADQIRIVARGEPPAETLKPEKPAKAEDRVTTDKSAVESCLQLDDLPLADSERIEGLLAEKWLAFKARRTTLESNSGYWVFIPPLATRQETDTKAAELKRLRVPELFIVQETGPNNRAISLGLFSTKEAAATRLDLVQSLGVKSARIGERNARPATVLLEIRGPETQVEALRQAIGETFPEGRLLACGKPVQ